MIACVNGERVLPPIIYTPKERQDAGVKGINSELLKRYIHDFLGQAVEGFNRYGILLLIDRASIHLDILSILQAFHEVPSYTITEVILMPPNSAKRLSPLDNAIFHDWKEEIRKHCPLTDHTIQRIMSDAWEKINPQSHYEHCGLTRSKDVYFDCPDPVGHHHHH